MSQQLTANDLDRAAAILAAGGLLAFPTETVYGLGADASDPVALEAVFRLKGRPSDHPLIVHLPDATQLEAWADAVPEGAYKLTTAFWPGPLTLVLKRRAHVSDALTGGQDTVGLRVSSHPLALALLAQFGSGVAAPSANRFGHVSPTTAEHVRQEFGEAVPVLDGGPCAVGLESTILDLSGNTPRILRPGAVSQDDLERVLEMSVETGARAFSPRVSGSLSKHYAPRTPTYLLEDAVSHYRQGDALLLRGRGNPEKHVRTLPDDPAGYGRDLYAALRDLDAGGYRRILIERVPPTPAWAAVRDRLSRAAQPLEIDHTVQEE